MTSEAPQDVAALRELAEAATPGPWELERWEDGWLVNGTGDYDGLIVADYSIADRDYDHTADAASPDVVLGLLDQNDRLRSALRTALRQWEGYADDGYPDDDGLHWPDGAIVERAMFRDCRAVLRGSGAEEAARNE